MPQQGKKGIGTQSPVRRPRKRNREKDETALVNHLFSSDALGVLFLRAAVSHLRRGVLLRRGLPQRRVRHLGDQQRQGGQQQGREARAARLRQGKKAKSPERCFANLL